MKTSLVMNRKDSTSKNKRPLTAIDNYLGVDQKTVIIILLILRRGHY